MEFNDWNSIRIEAGRKTITSRKKPHYNDPDVLFILGKLPWGIIRDRLYICEGADTPRELQEVIDKIFARRGYPVADDEEFYVHVIDTARVIKEIRNNEA